MLRFDRLQAATSEASYTTDTHYELHQHFIKASYLLQQPISTYQTGPSPQHAPDEKPFDVTCKKVSQMSQNFEEEWIEATTRLWEIQ